MSVGVVMVAQAAARWIGLRALFEGAAPTVELLAQAGGTSVAAILRRAKAEGWRSSLASETAAAGSADRLERVLNLVMREVEAIGAAAEAEGLALDKGRIDGVWSMIRTLEKVDAFARERAKESQTRQDAEMADVLQRIDSRIIELAREYAAELVRAEHHAA